MNILQVVSVKTYRVTLTSEYKAVKKLGQSVCYSRSTHPCGVAVQDVPVLK